MTQQNNYYILSVKGLFQKEITILKDKLSKLEARRRATNMSIHSSEYLYSNLQFAMKHLDKAPTEAQINLLKALIKAIEIYEDHIIMRMYVSEPSEELSCEIGEAIKQCEIEPTLQDSPERQ
ncbi:MAG: hypothetical protein GY817_04960 [bacterium]|nr:hypothetical protein [bacterium]